MATNVNRNLIPDKVPGGVANYDPVFRRLNGILDDYDSQIEALQAAGNILPATTTPADIAAAGAVGASAKYAREDHAHKGVRSIGKGTPLFGNVTITGAGVTQTGQNIDIPGAASTTTTGDTWNTAANRTILPTESRIVVGASAAGLVATTLTMPLTSAAVGTVIIFIAKGVTVSVVSQSPDKFRIYNAATFTTAFTAVGGTFIFGSAANSVEVILGRNATVPCWEVGIN